MALTVAIASESPFDKEIYRYLASTILKREIIGWTGGYTFTGCKAVAKLAPRFLKIAADHGIQHAILAVDNDGRSSSRPEHADNHIAPVSLADEDACRECWLRQAIPPWWTANGAKVCIAVPVQIIETWLLAIRGTPPFTTKSPEQQYHREPLKKAFFGKRALPVASRIELALAELQKPNALAVLAQRPSYGRFAAGFASWTEAPPGLLADLTPLSPDESAG